MRQISRRPLIVLSVLLILFSVAPAAQAQHFGQNKVQYKDFKFEVLKTAHFDIYFYQDERESAARVGRMAERWYTRLSQLFNHQMRTRQPLVLYASHPDFEQTNIVGGAIDEGTGGVTEGQKRRVVLPMAGTLAETDHVLGHELVHAFQYDIANQRAGAQNGSGGRGVESLPLWFIEGMAEYLSIGPVDAHTAMWIRDAARKEKLPTISDLDNPKHFPYRWGQALWAFVGGHWGDEGVPQIYRDALRSGDLDVALRNATGFKAKELSAEWHIAIHNQYDPILKANARVGTFGQAVTAASDPSKLAMNVSPSLSPDGKRLIYFSLRDMLSIGLFLADTSNGRIIRKLIDTTLDPHFSSLEFISSAGAWKPDSRQFVVGAIRKGKPVLAIVDVDNGNVVREIPFPALLGEILNPSWSPDGHSIAFSAIVGGDTDLFVYNLDTNAERRLTSDAFADIQPAWSPDGSRLAFVTDRFSTRLENLHAGEYQLATLDLASGRVEQVPTFPVGKSINPQWNADGRHLYFVSDRDGISNVYTVSLESGAVAQVTSLDAGVSGITALSPAISSAIDARSLALSAYENGNYHIYVIDAAASLAGRPISDANSRIDAAGLPPVRRERSDLVKLLADPDSGLPAEAGAAEPYHARLSLDSVSQPYLSAGVSRFGPSVGGGLAFNWSDMLGNQNLYAQVSADAYGAGFSDIAKNTGGSLSYWNLSHRLNWGVSIAQVPYMAGGYAAGVGTVKGETAYLDETIIQRQLDRGLNAGVAYPLNSSSRLEFGAGYSQLSFDQVVRTVATSLNTGNVISDNTTTISLASTLRMRSVNAAFVNDKAVFGATSPVAGQRARFEVSPTMGSLNFTSGLIDYRRYFMPARFYTLAVRGMQYGRYGTDSEDSRLVPLFLGYPEFVRGYGINSFQSSECRSMTGTCPTFDRLMGSRMMVGNVEFRFPLLRPFGVTSGMYGPVPIEVALFADGGVAWNRGERLSFRDQGARRPVSSAGLTLRTNLFGFAVAQMDFALPFDRPGRGWVWGLSLTPGF